MEQLNRDIESLRGYVEATNPDYPYLTRRVLNLERMLYHRYRWLNTAADLNEANRWMQMAMDICISRDSRSASLYNEVGNLLINRYRRDRNSADLDRAYEMHIQALVATKSDDCEMSMRLCDLATTLGELYKSRNTRAHLMEMIEVLRHPRLVVPDEHFGIAKQLASFGRISYRRYMEKNEYADLRDSINALREADKMMACLISRQEWRLIDLICPASGENWRKNITDDLREVTNIPRTVQGNIAFQYIGYIRLRDRLAELRRKRAKAFGDVGVDLWNEVVSL